MKNKRKFYIISTKDEEVSYVVTIKTNKNGHIVYKLRNPDNDTYTSIGKRLVYAKLIDNGHGISIQPNDDEYICAEAVRILLEFVHMNENDKYKEKYQFLEIK